MSKLVMLLLCLTLLSSCSTRSDQPSTQQLETITAIQIGISLQEKAIAKENARLDAKIATLRQKLAQLNETLHMADRVRARP